MKTSDVKVDVDLLDAVKRQLSKKYGGNMYGKIKMAVEEGLVLWMKKEGVDLEQMGDGTRGK